MEIKTDLNTFNSTIEKKIKVRIVSSRGHDEWEEIPTLALERIKEETNNNKKWLYIDGVMQNPSTLTVEKLITSEYVILTNALVGG